MLQQRSTEKELMDLGSDYYSDKEYQHCLKMLFRVNRLLGFYSSTFRLLKKFSSTSSVLDVGCGGGLFILNLAINFSKMQFKGIDISPEAILLAQNHLVRMRKKKNIPNVSFQTQVSSNFPFPTDSVDIILTTLVCHHMTDEEIVDFLKTSLQCARKAVIINDLHRHIIAYSFYSILSPLLFYNRLITHDGLISIRRGFKRAEWLNLLKKAGIKHYSLRWCFPFRWQLILWKK